MAEMMKIEHRIFLHPQTINSLISKQFFPNSKNIRRIVLSAVEILISQQMNVDVC